jgi:hypothetical protein
MRADSGFWSAKTIRACRRHGIRYPITVRQTTPIRAAIATISEDAWTPIVYPDGGRAEVAEVAEVAETRYQGDRPIARRTRLVGAQAELFPHWRSHAFVTDRVGTTVWLDADHRRQATVELCIRDLKAGVGRRHCPSAKFAANAAWLQIATLAHNLLRWVAAIGLGARGEGELVVAKTLRRTLLALPGRITRSARRLMLHLPAGWPWAPWFELAGLSWPWRGCAASPTPPDTTTGPAHAPKPGPGQRQPTQACLASGSRPPDRPEPAAPPSRSCLQHTPTTASNRAPRPHQPTKNSGIGGSRLRPEIRMSVASIASRSGSRPA